MRPLRGGTFTLLPADAVTSCVEVTEQDHEIPWRPESIGGYCSDHVFVSVSACGGTDPGGGESAAELQVKVIERLVSVDNSFGDGDPFDRVGVETVIGGDADRPLEPLALGMIVAALRSLATVELVPNAEAAIESYLENEGEGQAGVVAFASIDEFRIDGDRADIEVELWCGLECAIGLVYRAILEVDGWEIAETIPLYIA
jgi:hypothetical protein